MFWFQELATNIIVFFSFFRIYFPALFFRSLSFALEFSRFGCFVVVVVVVDDRLIIFFFLFVSVCCFSVHFASAFFVSSLVSLRLLSLCWLLFLWIVNCFACCFLLVYYSFFSLVSTKIFGLPEKEWPRERDWCTQNVIHSTTFEMLKTKIFADTTIKWTKILQSLVSICRRSTILGLLNGPALNEYAVVGEPACLLVCALLLHVWPTYLCMLFRVENKTDVNQIDVSVNIFEVVAFCVFDAFSFVSFQCWLCCAELGLRCSQFSFS